MSLQNAELLTTEIIEKRKAYLRAKIQRYPVKNFRASDITDCDRYMCYSVLNWKERTLHDEGLQAIFDSGNNAEKRVVIDLMELGYNFMAQQNPIEIKSRTGEVICVGHIDGKILFNGEAIPCEIKSMNMNTFNALNSLDDFHKRPLHRKYLRQMQLYLFGNNEEAGIFILTDLQGHYKLIIVTLDYGECELILKRLESNFEFIKKKEYPKAIEYQEKICGRCSFSHLCLQEIKNEGANFIDSPELEADLERREELKKSASEYDELDKRIKEPFKMKKIPAVFVGTSWQISTKVSESMRLDTKLIPDDIKKQYEVPSERVNVVILKLKGTDNK